MSLKIDLPCQQYSAILSETHYTVNDGLSLKVIHIELHHSRALPVHWPIFIHIVAK